MGFGTTAVALAAILTLKDELTRPLTTAVEGAKRQLDNLSAAGQALEKIKAFERMRADVEALGKDLEEAQRKRDFLMESATKGGDSGARMFATDIRAARQEVLDLDKTLTEKRGALNDMSQSLRTAGVDTKDLGAHVTRLNEQLQKEQGIKAFHEQLGQVSSSLTAVGKKLESIGLRVGAGGVAVQAGLQRADLDLNSLVKGAVNVEDALYGIAITAGQAGSQAKATVATWANEIGKIAVATNQTQAEVVTALQDLIAKGMAPDAAIKQLADIGRATTGAKADILSMASASNAAYQNMGVQANRSLEIMSQAGKSGAFELRDMAGYFDLLTVKSKLLGATGEPALAQLAAAAQIARKGAGDASTAANNLANFLDKLSAPITAKAFKKFGLNLAEETKKGLASGDLIGYMGDLIARTTQGDPATLAQLFTDVQAKNFIAPLIQNLDEYKRIRDDSLNANGVVDQDFATAMQSAAQQFKAAQIQAAAGVTGGGALKDIVTTLKELSGWASENPELVKWMIFGSAGAVVTGATLTAIGAALTTLAGAMTVVGTAWTAGLLAAALPAIAAFVGAMAAWKVGWAFGDWFNDQMSKAISSLTGGANKNLGQLLYDVIEGPNGVIATISGAWDATKAAATDLGRALKDGITDGIKGAFGIGEKLSAAVAYIRSTSGQWVQVGKDIIMGLWEGIKATIRKPLDAIGDLARDLPAWAKKLLDIHSPSGVFEEIGENVGAGLAQGIANSSADAIDSAKKMVGEVVAVSGDKTNNRNAYGQYAPARDGPVTEANMWQRGIQEYQDHVGSFANNIKNTVTRAFQGMEDAMVEFVRTGKLDFRSLANSIIFDMIRIQLQQNVTKPLASMLGSVNWGAMFAAHHTGGIVGLESPMSRMVNPGVFAGAPRFHTGGLVGGEVPIIAKRGEGVFTPEQMRALSPTGSGNIAVEMHFHNDFSGADSGAVARINAAVDNLARNLKPAAVAAVREAMLRNRTSPAF